MGGKELGLRDTVVTVATGYILNGGPLKTHSTPEISSILAAEHSDRAHINSPLNLINTRP